ncbi:MAG: hypothetical protein KAU28_05915, partial [Phycisphaerae bacterium]|nr:hypothetical protein [Phycisphaerae bacterium]
RIDNQLRGRSGRQGDPGSSRFFLSLRDDLMATFAGEWTLKVLGWLGLQGDAAIEDRRVSKGIERAQKKVEQRNFEIRKNLLEYDEIMDLQRHVFYSRRQRILEGHELEGLAKDMICKTLDEAVESYLEGRYPQRCIAEWARQNLQIPINSDQIRASSSEDLPSLEADLRQRAKEEARSTITMTLGEYMDEELDRKEWDLRGLSSWAMSRFNVNLSQNQLRKMTPQEVEAELTEAAIRKVDEIDLSPAGKFLAEGYAKKALTEWARNKFAVEVAADELGEDVESAKAALVGKMEAAYRRREIEYPVEYVVDMTIGQAGAENVYAMGNLIDWANRKYDAKLTVEDFRDTKVDAVRQRLFELSEQWMAPGKLEEAVRSAVGSAPDMAPAIQFARSRFDTELKPEDFDGSATGLAAGGDVAGKLIEVGRQFLRREMSE